MVRQVLASVQSAIETWATTDLGPGNPAVGPGVPLIVYILDHGAPDSFLINFTSGGASETMSSADLDGWLDTVQGGAATNPNGVETVVIYDACYSGSFLAGVGAGNVDRIIMSSSNDVESAYFSVSGTISFSQFFWQHVRQGKYIGEAFAKATLSLASWADQTPWLDDNGTGAYEISGSKDGDIAGSFLIGTNFTSGALLPALAPCEDITLVDGLTADLYTDVSYVAPDAVASVFAIITPPGYSPPRSTGGFDTPWLEDEDGNPLSRVYLEFDPGRGLWSHVFSLSEISGIFIVNGRYTASIYAVDREGGVSASADVILTIFGPDQFEDDDDWLSGSTIEVNAEYAQAHNTHDLDDVDWSVFEVDDGTTLKKYQVLTENLADNCDTNIWLYGPATGGSYGPLVAYDDDSGSSGGGDMIFAELENGTYFIKVTQVGSTVFGENTEYDLRVDRDELDYGSISGYVTDSLTGFGVLDADIDITVSASVISTRTNHLGYYHIPQIPAGANYGFDASKNYYYNFSDTVSINLNENLVKNLVLQAKEVTTGVIMGTVTDGAVPLGGVPMMVGGTSVESQPDGSYSVRLAQGAGHFIYINIPGYDLYTQFGIVVLPGSTTVANVVLSPIDADGDGIPDVIENAGCTDMNLPDTDGDGIDDGIEDANHNGIVDSGETDPCNNDTDTDTLNDGDEVITHGTSPVLADTDGDGVTDDIEVASCMNAIVADTDSDGLDDGDEDVNGDGVVDAAETDPCDDDTDNDTISDGVEVNIYGTNPLLLDSDSDGISDTIEVSACSSATNNDTDGDGIIDGTSLGEDKNSNGVVDSGETNPCAADSDSDGLDDNDEISTYGTNPLNSDSDADGLPDGLEVGYCTSPTNNDSDADGIIDGTAAGEDKNSNGIVDVGETDPCSSDTDGDGMPDGWESGYACVDALLGDSLGDPDSDGATNLSEYNASTDPCVLNVSDTDGDGITDIIEDTMCTSSSDPDSDGDGVCDGFLAVGATCVSGEDMNNDGVIDPTETDPCDADSDDDGLDDSDDSVGCLSALNWDSDGDFLPDGYEDSMSGASPPLDPCNVLDGDADFDSDNNLNKHEYYNGSGMWSENPQGNAGCYFWGDSGQLGTANGIVASEDIAILKLALSGGVTNQYDGVIPPGGDTHEFDADDIISGGDLAVMMQILRTPTMLPDIGLPCRPSDIIVIDSPSVPVAVGDTCRITLAVENVSGTRTPGIGIIYEIDPSSTGSAVILGGDGTDGGLTRFDYSGNTDSGIGGESSIVLFISAPGSIIINASMPHCGGLGPGRYAEAIDKGAIVTVTGE